VTLLWKSRSGSYNIDPWPHSKVPLSTAIMIERDFLSCWKVQIEGEEEERGSVDAVLVVALTALLSEVASVAYLA
jgi:hypothetical protein